MDRVTEIRCWIGGVGGTNTNEMLETRAGATWSCTVPAATRVVVVRTFADNDSRILLDKTL